MEDYKNPDGYELVFNSVLKGYQIVSKENPHFQTDVFYFKIHVYQAICELYYNEFRNITPENILKLIKQLIVAQLPNLPESIDLDKSIDEEIDFLLELYGHKVYFEDMVTIRHLKKLPALDYYNNQAKIYYLAKDKDGKEVFVVSEILYSKDEAIIWVHQNIENPEEIASLKVEISCAEIPSGFKNLSYLDLEEYAVEFAHKN